jgi:ribosomal protein S18 acetylase RimI-like enzyme
LTGESIGVHTFLEAWRMRRMEIRELGPGDEAMLGRLDFDGRPQAPLAPEAAARFLADEHTHLWVAFDGPTPIGMLLAYELPRRCGAESIVHVYELGVATAHRRRGVGSALWSALRGHFPGVEAYVLVEQSNASARAFYEAQGLAEPEERVLEYDGRLGVDESCLRS